MTSTEKPCRDFAAGTCRFGAKCRFSHGATDQKTSSSPGTPESCKYGNTCRGKGKTCWFDHPDGTKGVPRPVPDRKDQKDGGRKGPKLADLYHAFPKCGYFDGRKGSCLYGSNCLKRHLMIEGDKLCFDHCLNDGGCKKLSHPAAKHPDNVEELLSFVDMQMLEIFRQSVINMDRKAKAGRAAEDSDEAVADS